MQEDPPNYGDHEAPPDDNVRELPTRAPTPHLEAEKALLGALLFNPASYEQTATIVHSDDFDEPRHQILFDAMTAVWERDAVPPDHALIRTQLQRTGDYPKVAPLLPELITNGANPISLKAYARDVHEAADRRRIAARLRHAAARIDQTSPETWKVDIGHVMDEVDAALTFAPNGHTGPLHTDLTWLLSGQPPVVEPPVYVTRAAGGALFYPGRVNGIYGDPEAAKTWVAQVGIVEALTAGQPAGFIDVDHNGPQLTTERLLLLGATTEQLANPELFRYHEPSDGPELLATINEWAAWKPAYVVLDSIGEMMPMLGAKSVDNDELSGALRALTHPFTKQGACVVTVDHLPKSHEARTSGYAIGGTAKKRAIDGTLIHAEAKISPAPNAIGRIILRIEKDRPGRLRALCAGKYIGTFTLDSTNPGTTTTTIANESPVNQAGVFRPTGVMEAVSRHVEDNDQATFRDIKSTVAGKDSTIRAAIQCLRDEGFLTTLPGRNNSTIHHSIAPYREAEDDQA